MIVTLEEHPWMLKDPAKVFTDQLLEGKIANFGEASTASSVATHGPFTKAGDLACRVLWRVPELRAESLSRPWLQIPAAVRSVSSCLRCNGPVG